MDVGFGFRRTTDISFGKTHPSVSMGQIVIQRQRSFAFSDALSRAVRENLDDAEQQVRQGMLRSQRQSPVQRCLSRREARARVVG